MRKHASTNHYVLLAAAAVAVLAAGWFVLLGDAPVGPVPPVDEQRRPASMPASDTQINVQEARRDPHPPIPTHTPPAPVSAPVPVATAREIEAEYARATDTEARAEAARNLASLDTEESIKILARLFAASRVYTDRVAIVGALSDSQADAALETKISILRTSLAPGQVRQLRSAALDVAAQMDDPRALEMVQRAAQRDGDAQIRELAKALLGE